MTIRTSQPFETAMTARIAGQLKIEDAPNDENARKRPVGMSDSRSQQDSEHKVAATHASQR